MITTILVTAFIFLLFVGVMYATYTFIKVEVVRNILLVGEVLGLIVVLLRYFKQI